MDIGKLFKKAMSKIDESNFKEQINLDAESTFIMACQQIAINPEMTFTDGNNLYQLRIVKDKFNKYNVIKDIISYKTLKSLLKSNIIFNKTVEYANSKRKLNEPKLFYKYGFYVRKFGKLKYLPKEVLSDNALSKENVSYNKDTGEIKILQPLPVIKEHSALELAISCLTPNYKQFLDWLALYTFENRDGLKRPILCLHGDNSLPLLNIIESIYPNGFVNHSPSKFTWLTTFKNWQYKSNFYQYIHKSTNKLDKYLDLMAHPKDTLSNTYAIIQVIKQRYKEIKHNGIEIFNIQCYPEIEVKYNLEKYNIEFNLELLLKEIGYFCYHNLRERYERLMNLEHNMSCGYGMKYMQNDKGLSETQIISFFKYIVNKIKLSKVKFIYNDYVWFSRNKILSERVIAYYCIVFSIDYEDLIERAIVYKIIAKTKFIVMDNNKELTGFELYKRG